MNITTKTGKTTTTLLLLGVAIFLSAGVDSAFAHARLIKSDPTDTARLPSAPVQINLWFNEILDDGFNSIEVVPLDQVNAPKRESFAKGVPLVDPQDRTHLSITIAPLKPGDYIVDYRVLSRDGHTAPGRITFHILPPDSRSAAR